MSKVRLTTDDQQDWIVTGDGPLAPGRPTSGYRIREAGDGGGPQLLELTYASGAEIEMHRHEEDEILYVAAGAMVIGGQSVGPGGCLTVPGGTLYGFHAGPEGLHVLTFRARPNAQGRTSD